ncbi:hypothetical protein D3C76_1725160 [compost metagenome]
MGRQQITVAPALVQRLGTLSAGQFNFLLQALQLARVDHWADHGLLQLRIANLEALDPLDEALCEVLIHAVVDNDAVDRHADLPLV